VTIYSLHIYKKANESKISVMCALFQFRSIPKNQNRNRLIIVFLDFKLNKWTLLRQA